MALVLYSLVGVTAAKSALIQSDFDSATFRNIAPGWADNSGWADLDVHYSIDKTDAHRGGSQRIKCDRFGTGAVQFVHAGVPLGKGHRYRIRAWMKGNLSSPVMLLLRKHGGPYTTYAAKGFAVTDEWREYEFLAISHVNDDRAFFMVQFASTGTLRIDDVTMTDVTDETPVDRSLMNPGQNLLRNGGFEVGLDHWGTMLREDDYRFELPVYFSMTTPKSASDLSKQGRRSLEIDIPAHGQFVLTSPYVRINEGHEYTLSFWAIGDRPRTLRASIASGYFGGSASYDQSFSIGKTWKRYEFSARLQPAPEAAYYVLLDTRGEGRLWIDGVQLTEGKEYEYKPHSDVEIGFGKGDVPTLYDAGKPINLKTLLSPTGSSRKLQVAIRSTDYFGNVSVLLDSRFDIGPDEERSIPFSHPATQPGYYRISAKVSQDGKLLDSSQMAIGILRQAETQTTIDSPFGNHARFSKQRLQEARRLGVHWLRLHPPSATKWFVVEPTKGKFIFDDEAIRYAKSLGFQLLGLLETTPNWASSAPAGDTSSHAYPPKDLRDWERYVYETVHHYKGIIDHWEIWNEPTSPGFLKIPPGMSESRRPEVYTELLKTAYQAAKSANPEAVILGGCPTSVPPAKWFDKIFALGAYQYMDVLSYHYYTDGRPGDALDTPMGRHIDDLRKLERRFSAGSAKPIWETESGVMYTASAYTGMIEVAPRYLTPSRQAAAYVVRNYVHLLSSGVDKWFYYSMLPSLRTDRLGGSGFHEYDGAPRPLAIAYATLSWVLGPAKFVRSAILDGGITQVEFRDNARTIIVAWENGWPDNKKTHARISTPTSYRSLKLYDIMGRNIATKKNNGEIDLDLGRDPVYIVLLDPIT